MVWGRMVIQEGLLYTEVRLNRKTGSQIGRHSIEQIKKGVSAGSGEACSGGWVVERKGWPTVIITVSNIERQ